MKLDNRDTDGEFTKKIFDQDIGNVDWIHSKAVFANLVNGNTDFTSDFDFSAFSKIIDRIKLILDNKQN